MAWGGLGDRGYILAGWLGAWGWGPGWMGAWASVGGWELGGWGAGWRVGGLQFYPSRAGCRELMSCWVVEASGWWAGGKVGVMSGVHRAWVPQLGGWGLVGAAGCRLEMGIDGLGLVAWWLGGWVTGSLVAQGEGMHGWLDGWGVAWWLGA
jgi:hypothetical protein